MYALECMILRLERNRRTKTAYDWAKPVQYEISGTASLLSKGNVVAMECAAQHGDLQYRHLAPATGARKLYQWCQEYSPKVSPYGGTVATLATTIS
jgi:hypothetical protein